MNYKRYNVLISDYALQDIVDIGSYIRDEFKFEELVWDFIDKIQDYTSKLDIFPYRLSKTGFKFKGYDIYMRSYRDYLFFITIDERAETVNVLTILHEGMNWEYKIQRFIYEENL